MKCICTFSLLGKQKKGEDWTFGAFRREKHRYFLCTIFKNRPVIDLRVFYQGLPTSEGVLINPLDFTYIITALEDGISQLVKSYTLLKYCTTGNGVILLIPLQLVHTVPYTGTICIFIYLFISSTA